MLELPHLFLPRKIGVDFFATALIVPLCHRTAVAIYPDLPLGVNL